MASLVTGGLPVHAGVVTYGKWVFTVLISQASMRLRPGLELADSFSDACQTMEWVITVSLVLRTDRRLLLMLQHSLGRWIARRHTKIAVFLRNPDLRPLSQPELVEIEGSRQVTCTVLLA